MIKKFFKDITGITAREEEEKRAKEKRDLELVKRANEALINKEKAEARKKVREEKKLELKKLSPKDLATKKKEPWVDVIGFQTNKENVRYGFFELDWNEHFIEQLKLSGYGFDGDPEEEIVGRWFRDICVNAAAAEGIDMSDRSSGYINIQKISDTRSEAS